jgi:hypothetical protein
MAAAEDVEAEAGEVAEELEELEVADELEPLEETANAIIIITENQWTRDMDMRKDTDRCRIQTFGDQVLFVVQLWYTWT